MSGTSGDGVDAAILDTDGENEIQLLGGLTLPYSDDLRWRVLEASQHDVPIIELLRLEKELSRHHAEALLELLKRPVPGDRPVEVIGFHGHTIRHVPTEGLTLQIGNPWMLHEATGVPVITDFRRHDMVLGGHGAPLAAMFHQAIFANDAKPTMVLNLGGVANVTWLGDGQAIIAGDCGPGCGLLDEWAQEMANLPHDRDGHLAASGNVNWPIVEAALDTEFFRSPLPKSADRYDFDHVDVSGLSVEDGAATLCAVTVQAVVRATGGLPAIPSKLWVSGGGVHHPVIMEMLRQHFQVVENVSQRGLSPDTLEAECFAWLAARRLLGRPIAIPETTGCRRAACGGSGTGAC